MFPTSDLAQLMALLFGPHSTGTHEHKCPNPRCQCVWEHGDNMVNNEPAHRCPRCGTEQWIKYRPE